MSRTRSRGREMRVRGTFLVGILLLAALQLLISYTPHARAQAVFDPTTDIFLEYGAESGVLQPPWDAVGPNGQGSHELSKTIVDDTHTRTGTYSMYNYVCPPPKDDAQRRISNRYYSTAKEYYLSWWVYFDSWDYTDYSAVIGGWQHCFGTSARLYSWWEGGRFKIQANTGRFYFEYAWSGIDVWSADAWALAQNYYTDYYITDYYGQWIHLQVYVKETTDSTGIVRAWFNNVLVAEKTNIKTDPSGYPEWTEKNCIWTHGPYPWIVIELYDGRNGPENGYWVDDIVLATEKVSETYGVGAPSIEFESWEDGFESGDFSAWNGTRVGDPAKAWANVTSTYSYQGSYSANFTTDGSLDSYARVMHVVQNVTEAYQRSYVKFEDLPDTDNTRIMVLRVAGEDGAFIGNAGIFKNSTGYYWAVFINIVGGQSAYTFDASISADTWYEMEFYVNATTSGNSTLWVNGTKMVEKTGDFSSVGSIQRVYPYIYIDMGRQESSKTVYHDNYRVDDDRIGGGIPLIIQTSVYFSTVGEQVPLEDVKINGTRFTNSSGLYEWSNLDCDRVYTFAVEKPAGYYPAWVLNVEGSYSWNGTHYILRHNVTETQTGPIEIYFSPTNEVHIKSSTHKLTSVFYISSSKNPHTSMRFNITADIGATSRLEIYTADEGHPRPFKIEGATDWSYDHVDEILTVWILHTSKEASEIEWRGAAMGQ